MSLESIKAAKVKIQEQREIVAKEVKAVFYEEAKKLFVSHPDLIGFRWEQYTPYFNDGDACEFSARTDSPRIKFGGEKADDDDEDGYVDYYPQKGSRDPKAKAYRDIVEFLGVFDDEDYEGMFEDHVRVAVTKDGIEVEEYEHE